MSRNFRLDCTNSVLIPTTFGGGIAMSVIAGEACTELGCEGAREMRPTWFARVMSVVLAQPGRPDERKRSWN